MKQARRVNVIDLADNECCHERCVGQTYYKTPRRSGEGFLYRSVLMIKKRLREVDLRWNRFALGK